MNRSDAGKIGGKKSAITLALKKKLRIDEYNLNPKICSLCSNIIDYDSFVLKKSALKSGKIKNIFCNNSCSAKYNNSIKNKIDIRCLFCSNSTMNYNKYCSFKCQRQHRWLLTVESVNINGKLPDGTTQGTIRKFLLKTRERKCSICGLDNWFGRPLPVVADHINGNPYDHRLENLRLVCGNCNLELPTNTGKNRGNGRYLRKERYKDGKSY